MRNARAAVLFVPFVLGLASCGGGGGGGGGGLGVVLDQQNLLDGTLGGQGIGRFNDSSGAPDPAGTSFDWQDAQVFTVGVAGRLTSLRLPIFNNGGAGTLPVTVELRAVSAGIPDANDAAVLGSISVPAAAIPTAVTTNPAGWLDVDVTSLAIDVSVGQVLAWSVKTADPAGYLLQVELDNGYTGGAGFRRNRALTTTWSGGSFWFGFQTYVDD